MHFWRQPQHMLSSNGAATSGDAGRQQAPLGERQEEAAPAATRLRGGSAASGQSSVQRAGTASAVPDPAQFGPSAAQNQLPAAELFVPDASSAAEKPRLWVGCARGSQQRAGMALLCEELAASLLGQEVPHDRLAQALSTSLPGISCLRCAFLQPNALPLQPSHRVSRLRSFVHFLLGVRP